MARGAASCPGLSESARWGCPHECCNAGDSVPANGSNFDKASQWLLVSLDFWKSGEMTKRRNDPFPARLLRKRLLVSEAGDEDSSAEETEGLKALSRLERGLKYMPLQQAPERDEQEDHEWEMVHASEDEESIK